MKTRKEQTCFWDQKWQTNDIPFNQEKPGELLQQFVHALQLKPGDNIFVPLCGKSIDMLWLVQQGYRVTGIELSPIACEAFFTGNGIPYQCENSNDFMLFYNEQIKLYSGNFFDFNATITGTFYAVYDRAALIALPYELRQDYAAKIMSLLKPGASMLLIAVTYDQAVMSGPPFSVDEQEINQLYYNCFHIETLVDKVAASSPPHLQAKGLKVVSEQVYLLSKIILNF